MLRAPALRTLRAACRQSVSRLPPPLGSPIPSRPLALEACVRLLPLHRLASLAPRVDAPAVRLDVGNPLSSFPRLWFRQRTGVLPAVARRKSGWLSPLRSDSQVHRVPFSCTFATVSDPGRTGGNWPLSPHSETTCEMPPGFANALTRRAVSSPPARSPLGLRRRLPHWCFRGSIPRLRCSLSTLRASLAADYA